MTTGTSAGISQFAYRRDRRWVGIAHRTRCLQTRAIPSPMGSKGSFLPRHHLWHPVGADPVSAHPAPKVLVILGGARARCRFSPCGLGRRTLREATHPATRSAMNQCASQPRPCLPIPGHPGRLESSPPIHAKTPGFLYTRKLGALTPCLSSCSLPVPKHHHPRCPGFPYTPKRGHLEFHVLIRPPLSATRIEHDHDHLSGQRKRVRDSSRTLFP